MKKLKGVYADDLPYWKTSTSALDSWIEKAKGEIVKIGGKITGEAFASSGDEAGYLLLFSISGDDYKVYFPVLEPKKSADLVAAKRQAATMLYHDIKARCMLVKVFGARRRFADFLLLPDKSATVGDSVEGDLLELPRLLMADQAPQLISGEIVNG